VKNGFREVKAATVVAPYHPRQELDWQPIEAAINWGERLSTVTIFSHFHRPQKAALTKK